MPKNIVFLGALNLLSYVAICNHNGIRTHGPVIKSEPQ